VGVEGACGAATANDAPDDGDAIPDAGTGTAAPTKGRLRFAVAVLGGNITIPGEHAGAGKNLVE
jgi:hypothetical protein